AVAVTPASKETNDAPQQSEGGFGWIIWLVVGLVLLWVFVALVRALFRSNQPHYTETRPPSYGPSPSPAAGPGYGSAPPAPAPPPQSSGRGGGFFSSFLGSMFGSAAGSWMYDSFFRSSRSSGANWTSPPARSGDPFQSSTPSNTGSGDRGY